MAVACPLFAESGPSSRAADDRLVAARTSLHCLEAHPERDLEEVDRAAAGLAVLADLGVMVPADARVEAALEVVPDADARQPAHTRFRIAALRAHVQVCGVVVE